MTNIYRRSRFPLHHTYKGLRRYDMQFSSNISGLYVNNENDNGIHEQLLSAYIGTNISQVPISCFANCVNLTAINADNQIKKVSDYAFYNCKSLEEVNFLGWEGKELYNIGNYAFAGSGLKNIKINLKSSVSDSSINGYAFANCKQLQSVEFMDAPFLGPHIFDGCSKLQNVKFTNKHNYTYPYCFANCTSLRSITLPANQYSLASHMFDGCTSLKEVKFEKGSILHYIEDHVFANCPSLTSITLPQSVNSLSIIDPEFLADSSVNEVVFSGIPDDDLRIETRRPKELKFETGKIYNTNLKAVWECGVKNNVPIVAWLTKGVNQGCGHCDDAHKNVIEPLKSFFASSGYLICSGEWVEHYDEYKALEDKIEALKLATPGTWIFFYLYWKKEDGTEQKWTSGSQDPGKKYKDTFKDKIKSMFAGYEPVTEIEYAIDPKLTTFGRGTGQKVVFISSTGQRYECVNDSVTKQPEYIVDKYTTDNFKFGIWYYNARELKAFADANHLPVLVERSSKGCEPCIDFRRNTWRNAAFQDAIKQKPCLLCKVEVDGATSFDSPPNSQAYFIAHNWCDPNTLIPEILYYWKKSDGSTYAYDWPYNYRTDATNANYQTVLNRLDAMLGNYEGDSRFVAPTIHSSNNGQCLYYTNEDGDGIGKYFICDKKQFRTSYSGSLTIDVTESEQLTLSYVPKIDISHDIKTIDDQPQLLGTSITQLAVGQSITLPKFTYQYFTSFNTTFPTQKGIIFKVDDNSSGNRVITYIYEFLNEEYSEYTPEMPDKFELGRLYEMTVTSDPLGFTEIADFAGRTPTKLLVVFKINESDTNIESKLLADSSFQSWIKKSGHLFVKVKSSTWTSNAPQAIVEFENMVNFEGNNKSDSASKILVLHQCLDCVATPNGYIGEIYKAKAIYYDSSKNTSHYTALIDSCKQK